MQKRSPRKIFLLQIITLGIYLLYWCAKSRKEVNGLLRRQAVPTVWWFIVPFGCFWWAWLYAEALEEATAGQLKRDNTFGIWLIAALGVSGSGGFSYHFNYGQHSSLSASINWTIVAIAIIAAYLVFVTVLGIFPTIMQSKFNKLNLAPKS